MIVAQTAKSKNDEYYTPAYAIEPIKKYLKPNSVIWCPFDTENSHYVKEFEKDGHKVIFTHINNNEDFFNLDIECDYIISNPPYSRKLDVLQRLFELKKPFAMLVGVVGLFDSQKKMELFKNNDFEIMYISPRVNYFKDIVTQEEIKGIPYQSAYLCKGLLPKQIIFEKIEKGANK